MKRPPMTLSTLRPAFAAHFGAAPDVVVKAPGRVNLIGDHTDYNEGFVLPMAIDYAVWIALRPRPDRQVVVHSLDFNETRTLKLDDLPPPGRERGETHWSDYLMGVAWAWQNAGYAPAGFDGVLGGDVPIGAGLSSSAALEMATLRAFAAVSGLDWLPVAMARLGQRVENQWLGLQSGIMDQLISAAGVAGHALLIDCRSLETTPVPLPVTAAQQPVAVLVLDTGTRRGLVGSAYNERRDQCASAAAIMGVPFLRDAGWAAFQQHQAAMPPVVRQRARHVISENERTVQAAQAMAGNDVRQVGLLMNASHASLRDDFAVSSPELDLMVDLAQAQEGCFGARMTGAGFGGCAVALVDPAMLPPFQDHVSTAYAAQTGITPDLFLCRPADGAQVVKGL